MINLPAIFNNTNIKSSLVTNKFNFLKSIVAYDLTVPICYKIFINLIDFTLKLHIDEFLAIQYIALQFR